MIVRDNLAVRRNQKTGAEPALRGVLGHLVFELFTQGFWHVVRQRCTCGGHAGDLDEDNGRGDLLDQITVSSGGHGKGSSGGQHRRQGQCGCKGDRGGFREQRCHGKSFFASGVHLVAIEAKMGCKGYGTARAYYTKL